MKIIELRVKIKKDCDASDEAELIKDTIYNLDEGEIVDVTYEIFEVKDAE